MQLGKIRQAGSSVKMLSQKNIENELPSVKKTSEENISDDAAADDSSLKSKEKMSNIEVGVIFKCTVHYHAVVEFHLYFHCTPSLLGSLVFCVLLYFDCDYWICFQTFLSSNPFVNLYKRH